MAGHNDDSVSVDAAGAFPDRWEKVGAVVLPALAAAASLAVSWQRWINPFVDSGRELDVPWRLLQGERLYRDVTYYYGPLGPWLNALALRLFGNRWLVLELVCAALSALLFLLLFRLTRRAGGLLSATVATTLSAALCMGAPRGGAFIFPYSSSSLYALAGAFLALDAMAAPGRRHRVLCVMGLAVALASRAEIGAAACAALVIAGLRSRPAARTRAVLADAAVAALLACGVYAIACAGIPWRDLLSDGPLAPFFGMPEEWKSLYLNVSGLAQPWNAAARIGVALLLDAALVVAAGWLALPRPDRPARRHLFTIGFALVVAAYACSPLADPFGNLPPVLAVLPLVAIVAAFARLARPLEERSRAQFLLFFFSAAVAVRVLFGVALGPRMSSYVAPALPGLLATAAVLAFDLLAPRLPAPALFQRRLAAVFAVVAVLFLFRIACVDNGPGIVKLETPAGALRLPARQANAIARTLSYMQRNARQGETLTAFPESGFFNFVLGLRSPLRQDLFIPGVLSGARDAAAAQRVDTAGPKYILLCNRPTPEYGEVAFGRDYAAGLWREIEDRYMLVEAFGRARPNAPVGAKRFFIRIYFRAPRPPKAAQLPTAGPWRGPSPTLALLQ